MSGRLDFSSSTLFCLFFDMSEQPGDDALSHAGLDFAPCLPESIHLYFVHAQFS